MEGEGGDEELVREEGKDRMERKGRRKGKNGRRVGN